MSVAIYIVAGINHDRFRTEHPTIRGKYPQEEITAFKRRFPVLIAAPTCLILSGVMLVALLGETAEAAGWEPALGASFLLCVAIAMPVFIYAGIQNKTGPVFADTGPVRYYKSTIRVTRLWTPDRLFVRCQGK